MTKTILALTASSLAVASVLAGGAAKAQDATDTTLEEINVSVGGETSGDTAGYGAKGSGSGNRGLPADLATSPRSVSVITSRQISDQGATSLEDAISYTAGVNTQVFGMDNRYDQFAIRGFETQTSGNYRDGMPLRLFGWGAWRTETFGLERIEVLRGPTASLYGSNEPGGLVNAVTKRPTFDTGTEIMGRTTINGGLELGFDTQGLLSDTVAYRFVGLGSSLGTAFNETDEERIYFAPSLTWRPTDATNVTFFAQYQKDKVGDTYVLVPQYGSQLDNPLGEYGNDFYPNNKNRNDIDTTQSYVGYEFDHEFENGLTFRSRARYADNDWVNKTGYAGFFFGSSLIAGNPHPFGAIDAANLVDFDVDQNTKQLTFDNALSGEFTFGNVVANVIGGVDYYRSDYNNDYSFGYGGTHLLQTGEIFRDPRLPNLSFATAEDQKIRQTGLYLLSNLEIGNNLIIDAGLRHDWVDITGSQTSFGFTSTNENDQSFTSGNLGASYNFDNGVTVYGSASRSFNLPPAGFDISGDPLDVEKSDAFEIGTRFSPLGSNSLVSVALFDITKKNTVQPVLGVPGAVEQVGEVNSRGLELEVNYAFNNGVSLLGAYTYLDAKITDDADNEGNRLGRIPEHSGSVWLAYDFAQVEGLRAGLGMRYTGERFSDNGNTEAFKLDDVTVFDASVSYAKNGWVTTLAARNLANKEYVTYCTPGSTLAAYPGADLAQSAGCAYGAGRTVELTVSRRF